jgi:major inositol transporter-like SP family MFS transporter
MYYAPTMLTATGLSNDAALFATIANGVISVLMTLVGIWMIGKIGRRPLVLVGQMGCTACLFFIAAVCFFMPEYHSAGDVNLLRAYLVLAGMLMFLCFQQGALSPVTWLLLSEIFPARMRGICMGGAVFALWMANFAISMAFPLLLAAFGLAGAFLTFAVIGIGGSMFVLRTIPETKGRSLEQVEHYFHELYK